MVGIRKTVLVVDDDKMVHEVLEDSLNKHLGKDNVKVLSAYNGKEAIDLFSKSPGSKDDKRIKIDIMFLDYDMPIMNGVGVLENILQLGIEDIKIINYSGAYDSQEKFAEVFPDIIPCGKDFTNLKRILLMLQKNSL